MKQLTKDIYYSLPIQLFILHFRKFQVLLVFWYIIGSTINSGFMKSYGADALFFSPEYLGKVNALSAAIVGMALGVFIMSWNITTFILHGKRCKFLATTAKPFLKYCINNAVIVLTEEGAGQINRLVPNTSAKHVLNKQPARAKCTNGHIAFIGLAGKIGAR